jgi:plastocyanin
MSKSAIIGIVIAAIVIVVGGFLLFKPNKKNNTTATNTQPSSSASTQSATTNSSTNSTPSSSSNQSSGATITYSDSGFSPATLTVKAGTTVTIKNTSSQPMQFDSDPHPVHTDDTQLNVGEVAPGQSMTFTPTITGTHGYHNHLDSSQTGTLIVQ